MSDWLLQLARPWAYHLLASSLLQALHKFSDSILRLRLRIPLLRITAAAMVQPRCITILDSMPAAVPGLRTRGPTRIVVTANIGKQHQYTAVSPYGTHHLLS